ncbi:MAG TPA: outer membrane beta-barrel domain-containing protein [Polyangiaceae bacterium]|nr:outer membrane beta-barrel domain-containing protein [Polyangiaceae bacterium]
MNQARIGLLVMAAMIAAPSFAHAQKKKKPAAKPAPAAPAAPPSAPPVDAAAAGVAPLPPAQGPTEIDADAPAGAPAAEPGGPEGPTPEPGDLGEICKIDPSACPTMNLAEEAKKDLKEQMYAVQQIYALRYHRFEIQPAWNAITMNDQFVSHPGPVVALNFYVTNVLAVGVSGGYYFNNDSTFNFQTRRAARVAVPLTEYQWQAALNFTYVPMYGKFAGFSDFIFHYDAYLVGGVGAISTRPIAVVDPDNRSFSWDKPKLDFNVGIGLRIFFNRWFAGVLEVRDYIFLDKLENTEVYAGAEALDQKNWYGQTKLTNNVQAQLGVSIFLPFAWEYRLPK